MIAKLLWRTMVAGSITVSLSILDLSTALALLVLLVLPAVGGAIRSWMRSWHASHRGEAGR